MYNSKCFENVDKYNKRLMYSLAQYDDRYGVEAGGGRHEGKIRKVTRQQLLCALRQATVRTLRDGDQPFTDLKIAKHFPR